MEKTSEPSLAVVIINWNAIDWTRQCLANLEAVAYGGNLEIFVADNNSGNAEADALQREFGSRIHMIRNPKNLGFAGGNNSVLSDPKLQEFAYVVLLNNDVSFPPDLFSKLVSAAEGVRNAGVIGPLVRNWDGVTIQSAGAKRINLWTGSASMQAALPSGTSEPYGVAMLSGCCFMIKGELLRTVGLLDPDYFAYYEETDYCFRATQAGYVNLLVPEASIKHYDGGSAKKGSDFRERLLLRNRFLLVRKHGSVLQRMATVCYVSPFYIWARSLLLMKDGIRHIPAMWKGYGQGVTAIVSRT